MIPQNCPPPRQVILTGHLDPLVSDWSVWHNEVTQLVNSAVGKELVRNFEKNPCEVHVTRYCFMDVT